MIVPGRPRHSFNQNICAENKGLPLYFIMMRLNLKVTLLCLCIVAIFTTLSFWTRCSDTMKEHPRKQTYFGYEEIDCIINGDYTVGCHKEGDEVFVPFSFIHKYFEIYGKLATTDGVERFEWTHSVGKVYRPKGKYDPRGVFMHFENFNVEARDRVKCVSAIDGVPVSTQWESRGYPYPTQIAQFGLAHYSKNLTEPEPRRKVLEDGDKELAKWIAPKASVFSRHFDAKKHSFLLNFTTDALFGNAIKLKMDHVLDFVMSVNIFLYANSSLTIVMQNREKKDFYNLHYIANDVLLSVQDENIYHGIGMSEKWHKLTRDLIIDLQKGVYYVDKSKRKVARSKLKIVAIILHGRGQIDNLTLSTSEHISQFYDAADWFVANQDALGGWSISVKRKLAAGFQDLEPGWYSAMGQGQAISVLTRAFHHSGGQMRYLHAALDALKPFKVPNWQGGVLATFLNKFHWYEEYPTKPSCFVLNGFIYSLLGLYDLITIAPLHQRKEAEVLFEKGMIALKSMLMLFDMGSATAYDLRHFTLGIAPNLARWDYHVTHINQLLLLSTIDTEPIFQQTAERWIGYMSGKRAAHN